MCGSAQNNSTEGCWLCTVPDHSHLIVRSQHRIVGASHSCRKCVLLSFVQEAFNKAFTWRQEREQQVEPDAAEEQQDPPNPRCHLQPAAQSATQTAADAAAPPQDLGLLEQQQSCSQPSGTLQSDAGDAPALPPGNAAPPEQQHTGQDMQQPAQGVQGPGHTGPSLKSSSQLLHDKQDPDTLRQGPVTGCVGGREQQQCQAVASATSADVSHVHRAADGPAESMDTGVDQAQCAWCGAGGAKLGSGPVSNQPC